MRTMLVILGVLGWAGQIVAQTHLPHYRDDVVVTASLEREEGEALPVSVEVIDAAEIAARQATTVAELLTTLAGVDVVRSGSPGQVTSAFTRGTESDHTLVLWNGIELNDPYFGGYNWAFLPTEGVERVEVVKGPFSALYGSDALGGVVQVLSGSFDGVGLRLEGGGEGYRRGSLVAGTDAGPVRFDLAGHLRRGNGQFANDFHDNEEVVARVAWAVAPQWSIGLTGRAHDARTGIPFVGVTPSPDRRLDWRERELSLPVEGQLGDWRLEGRLSRVDYENRFEDPNDLYGFIASQTESTSHRGRVVATWRPGERAWLAVGSEVERQEVNDRSVFGVALDGASQSTAALFGQAFYRRGPWRFDLGLRRDDHSAFGGRTTPRAGVALMVGERGRLHIAYGQGFRAPSLGELYFPVTGNPGLQAERSESLELGAEIEADLAGGRWRASLTGFDNRLTDLIDFDFASFSNVNVGRARSRGVESRVTWSAAAAAVSWNGTWLDADDLETGLPLLRRPAWSSNLGVTAWPANWTLNLTARYVGARDDVDPVDFSRQVNPSYWGLDLAAEWRLSRRVAPYIRVENATDESYQEALGFPALGRTWVGGLSLEL